MAQKGETIANRYRLLEKLGEGALGEVWAARDENTEREFAVKLLKPKWAIAPKSLESYFRESKAAAKIRHISIVELLDAGETVVGEEKLPFVTMELLEAEKLEEVLERARTLSVGTTLRLGSDLAWALCAAHEKSIVHERIEPANVLLHRDVRGEVVPKLVDFGVARLVDDLLVLPGTPHDALSPVHYLSPEQIHADVQLDGRADVFGLAALLHRCLVGEPPFDGDSADEVLEAIEEGPKKLEPFEPPIDIKVIQLVAEGLQRNRKLRPTMRVLAERIDALRERIEADWRTLSNLVQIPERRTLEHISKLRPGKALARIALVKQPALPVKIREEVAPAAPRRDAREEDLLHADSAPPSDPAPRSSRESLPSEDLEDAPASIPMPAPEFNKSKPPPLPKPGLEDAPPVSEIIREKMKKTANDPLSLDVLADLEKELLRHVAVARDAVEPEPTPVEPPPDVGLFKGAASIPPTSGLLYSAAPDSERTPPVLEKKPEEARAKRAIAEKTTRSSAATANTLPPRRSRQPQEDEKKSNAVWIIGGLAALFLIGVIWMQKNQAATAGDNGAPAASESTPIAAPPPPPPVPSPVPVATIIELPPQMSPPPSASAPPPPTASAPPIPTVVPTAAATATATATAVPTATAPTFPTTKPTATPTAKPTATAKPTNDPTFGVDNAGF